MIKTKVQHKAIQACTDAQIYLTHAQARTEKLSIILDEDAEQITHDMVMLAQWRAAINCLTTNQQTARDNIRICARLFYHAS